MKRVIILGLLSIILILIFSALFYKGEYPLVLVLSKQSTPEISSEKLINPLQNIDLDNGEFTVYLIIHRDDFRDLTPILEHYHVWSATSRSILQEIKSTWNFVPSGGDMTCSKCSYNCS